MSDLMRYKGMDANRPFKRGELMRVSFDDGHSFMRRNGLMLTAIRQSDGERFSLEYWHLKDVIYDWELA